MLNPKYQRYADRLQELINVGDSITYDKYLMRKSGQSYADGTDSKALHAWLNNVSNILNTLFGPQSPQVKHFIAVLPDNSLGLVEHTHHIYPIIGVLQGALDDLEHGFLIGQEFLIAGDVFDSVLEQAKYLVDTGYKDPAAVLARVVLEDALKRIARAEGIDDTLRASQLNDELRKASRYHRPQWRRIQAWLDVGNAAAHGKFDEYTADDVKNAINGIEQFLATELRI